ncbi:MAG TPA: hypothetical protein VFW44_00380 [Bryobacteraceae bacterium]|nr:hypothetical protein [Bryobacteraceae bacterium]
MILCAEVGGYELVLAQTPNNHWSLSLRGTGYFLTPLNEICESLDDAKSRACLWAAKEAGIQLTDDLMQRTRWRECRGY